MTIEYCVRDPREMKQPKHIHSCDLQGLVEVDDDPAGVAEEEEDHDHHQHARHRAVPPNNCSYTVTVYQYTKNTKSYI